jgi:hypothetical protein
MPVFSPSGKDFRTSGPWLANGAIAALYYTITVTVGAKLASLQNAQAGNARCQKRALTTRQPSKGVYQPVLFGCPITAAAEMT